VNRPVIPPEKSKPSKDGWAIVKRILGLLAPYKMRFVLASGMLVLSVPGELVSGFVAIYIVDHIILKTDRMQWLDTVVSMGGLVPDSWPWLLTSACVWMVLIYITSIFFDAAGSNLMERTCQKFIVELRQTVYDKIQSQTQSFMHRQSTGDLMSRAMSDVGEVQSFVTSSIDVIFKELLLWIAVVVTVFLLDWRVALATLLPILAVYFLLRMFNKKVAPIYKSASESKGKISSRLQENLSGMVVIQTFARERFESKRFYDVSLQNYQDQVKSINARTIYFPLGRVVGFLSNVGMLGVGGALILANQGFTIGTMLAFRAYWWRLFGPVYSLARVNDMIQRAIASARRVFEVLDEDVLIKNLPDAKPLRNVNGHLLLDNLSFAYDIGQGKTREVLRDITIDIPAGKRVALCGPSGSGKSTLLGLIVRFYDPTTGRVLIDGQDLRTLTLETLRPSFALVQQETFLFRQSVLDNIRYGNPDATLDQIHAAAKAAVAHDFILQLPNGYDTEVGERGVRLSGGQKQRISIARAFLADPRILLLDEPTSSVEPDSENAIIEAIDHLMTGRTTVLTSHRPSLIAKCDIVYIIDQGTVIDSGPPHDVRQRNDWLDRFLSSGDVSQKPVLA
jgi:ATP-binding cassette, subfamily B, bacterial